MKKLVYLGLVFFLSTFVYGKDFRSIRVSTFDNEKSAKKEIQRIEKYFQKKPTIIQLQKKLHFKVKMVHIGKYYVDVVEPFYKKDKDFYKVLDTIKLKYPHAYIKKIKGKKEKKHKVEKKVIHHKKPQKNPKKQKEIKKEKAVQKRVEKKIQKIVKKAKQSKEQKQKETKKEVEVLTPDIVKNKSQQIAIPLKQKVSVSINELEVESVPQEKKIVAIKKEQKILPTQNTQTKISSEVNTSKQKQHLAVTKEEGNTSKTLEIVAKKIKEEVKLPSPKEEVQKKVSLPVIKENEHKKEKPKELEKTQQPVKKEKVAQKEESYLDNFNYLMIMQIFLGVLTLLLGIVLFLYFRANKEINILRKKEHQNQDKLKELELEMLNKEKFITQVGNDFKEPIGQIYALTQEILKEKLKDEVKEYVFWINETSQDMVDKIDDILDISKIQNKDLILKEENFNLNDIIEDVFEKVLEKGKKNNTEILVDLDHKLPIYLVGDATRVEQILFNILDNAVKFTKNGYVDLSVKNISKVQEKVTLEFSISDTGIGMIKEDIEKAFLPYNQLDESIAKEYGGVGLGLFVAKQLIEMMDGDISIESKKGKGTRVVFHITFLLQDKLERRLYRLPSTDYLDKTVLIVESSQKYLLSLIQTVGYFKYDIDTIDSFEDANINFRNTYDIVIVNQVKMSEVAIEAILEFKTKGDVKVVIFGEEIHPKFAKMIDIDFYLTKPITQNKIFKMISGFDFGKSSPIKRQKRAHILRSPKNDKQQEELPKESKEIKIEQNDVAQDMEFELSPTVGLSNCNNDEDLYKVVLQEFLTSYASSDKELKKLVEEKKFAKARRYAIEIKDSSLYLGAYQVVENIALIEYELEKENEQKVLQLLEPYSLHLHKLLKEIEQELHK
ncbi:sensory transduction protein kinase [hydrothermal vent metagenome]|uniref:Sensory transduction protein kinase n=1 Tax=hydrothermal vent metagenome TaxID=652676 RepID=A0A1W1D1P4_9ZZZZ